MAYSDSFPAIRPSFQFNADAGRLDPRISYSRSTTGTYFGTAKHESSQNLVLQSSSYDTTWSELRLDLTGGQTDPSGGSGAWKLAQESGQTSAGEIYQYVNASAARHVLSFYAKAGTNRNFIQLTEALGNGTAKYSYINLSTGAAATVDPSHSFTVTAVGSTGWYRISVPLTPNLARSAYIKFKPIESDASVTVTDNQGFIYLWGVQLEQLDTNGPTPINQTTTQIHRAYAPTLQTAAINAPRFEHSASDSASEAIGQSRGLLIEGQVTNVLPFSTNGYNASNAFVWSSNNIGATENAAVAPSGNLEATLIREDGTTNQHNFYRLITATAAPYTYSIYVKDAGVGHVGFRLLGPASYGLVFNLSDGSTSALYNPVDSYGYEDVGNGWKRIWVTKTLTAAPHNMMIYLMRGNGSVNYAGDNYSGLLWYGAQIEQSSFPSSYTDTGTSGSTVTRAADSASMDLTAAGFNGGPFSVVSETEGGQGNYPRAWAISDGTANNRLVVYRNSTTASGSTDWYSYAVSDGSAQVSSTITSSASAGKLAVSYGTNDVSTCASGGTVTTDTSAVVPSGITTLYIGDDSFVGLQLNGHYKRIAIYGEALSDTNLISLTK